jgi:hypothetical protein
MGTVPRVLVQRTVPWGRCPGCWCSALSHVPWGRCPGCWRSALSHGDGAPGAGAEDYITSARRFWRAKLGSRPRRRPTRRGDDDDVFYLFFISRPALQRRLWRVVSRVDILLDVIGGVEIALREGCTPP